MKKLALFFLLLPLLIKGQTSQPPLNLRIDVVGYVLNPYELKTILVSPADTLLPITIKGRSTELEGSQLTTPQPSLSRVGLSLGLKFPKVSNLLNTYWYQVYSGNRPIVTGKVSFDLQPGKLPQVDNSLVATLNSQIGTLQAQVSALQQVTKMLDPTDITYLNLYSQLLLYK